jgi:hypothetical protein
MDCLCIYQISINCHLYILIGLDITSALSIYMPRVWWVISRSVSVVENVSTIAIINNHVISFGYWGSHWICDKSSHVESVSIVKGRKLFTFSSCRCMRFSMFYDILDVVRLANNDKWSVKSTVEFWTIGWYSHQNYYPFRKEDPWNNDNNSGTKVACDHRFSTIRKRRSAHVGIQEKENFSSYSYGFSGRISWKPSRRSKKLW